MMEKYSLDANNLLIGLQNEEAQIMTKIAAEVAHPLSDGSAQQALEQRLFEVRAKIDELRSKIQAQS